LTAAKNKNDIALIAECSLNDVNGVLKAYKGMRDLQVWLKGLKDKGEVLPDNQADLTDRFRRSRTVPNLTKHNAQKSMKFTAQDRKRMIKWGQKAVLKKKTPSYRMPN
jgi:hypothetical protein